MPHNERNAGRKPLPPNNKKKPVTIFLKGSYIKLLIDRYGSAPAGIKAMSDVYFKMVDRYGQPITDSILETLVTNLGTID